MGKFGQLGLEVTSVGLEAITLPNFDSKEVVVVPFGFQVRVILSEEHFIYLLEVVKRMWRQRVELIRRVFQTGRKG